MNMPTTDPTMERLDDQIGWYNRKSIRNQRVFKWLKGIVIGSAALIPLSAGIGMPALVTGGLGALVAILEGLQQLNQYDHNWMIYRSTCEALKHEKYLYLAKAGPYSTTTDAHALLAERIESLISREHAKWISVREKAKKTEGAM
jgi:hypothetical protein